MPSQPIPLTFQLLAISVFSVSQGHLSPRGGSRSETNPRSLCPCTPSSSSTCSCESPLVTWNTRTRTTQWADLPLSLWQFNFHSLSRSKKKTLAGGWDCSHAAALAVSPRRVGVLILSSCYMAFKIVALEQRLNSLVSTGEHLRNEWAPARGDRWSRDLFLLCVYVYLCYDLVANSCRRNALSHRSQSDINAEIYGELSTNLFKLEKVCLRFPAQQLWPLESVSVYDNMLDFICFRLGFGFIDTLC